MATLEDLSSPIFDDDVKLTGEQMRALRDNQIAINDELPSLGTPVATTSGSSVTFTGLTGAKQIFFNFTQVSTDGTANLVIQIGDAGGIEDADYHGSATRLVQAGAVNVIEFTNGAGIIYDDAGSTLNGTIILTLENESNNTWSISGKLGEEGVRSFSTGSSKSLSGPLTQVRLLTTDILDGGEVNILK